MNEERLLIIGKAIDHLVNVDISGRGIIGKLHSFALEKTGEPLALKAAKGLMKSVKERSVVFICTGWVHRPWASENIAETDGPPGAASLALSLHKAFGIVPIVITEQNIIKAIEKVIQAAGFVTLKPDEALKTTQGTPFRGGLLKAASVISFPIEAELARIESVSLIERYNPTSVIVIEKGGMNETGAVHSSRGDDTSESMAKVDYLVMEATRRGIFTIGIGDGGNEIGMGLIKEKLKEHFPLARKCNCPCGKGIAPEIETDCLVTANVSNWGAYAVEACLAVLKQDPDILHNEIIEDRILTRTADAQLADGISGYAEPSVDGMLANVHRSLIVLLREIVKRGIPEIYGKSRFAR